MYYKQAFMDWYVLLKASIFETLKQIYFDSTDEKVWQK